MQTLIEKRDKSEVVLADALHEMFRNVTTLSSDKYNVEARCIPQCPEVVASVVHTSSNLKLNAIVDRKESHTSSYYEVEFGVFDQSSEILERPDTFAEAVHLFDFASACIELLASAVHEIS